MTGDRAPDTQPARPRDCTATARSASETTRSHRSASDRPRSCALPPASALRPQCLRESFPMAPADQWPQADRLSPRAPPAAYPCRKSPLSVHLLRNLPSNGKLTQIRRTNYFSRCPVCLVLGGDGHHSGICAGGAHEIIQTRRLAVGFWRPPGDGHHHRRPAFWHGPAHQHDAATLDRNHTRRSWS